MREIKVVKKSSLKKEEVDEVKPVKHRELVANFESQVQDTLFKIKCREEAERERNLGGIYGY